ILKIQILLCLVVLLLINYSCINDQSRDIEDTISINENITTIKIPDKLKNLIQTDSLFENVHVIRLETSDECLFAKPVKVLFHKNRIYIQDHNRALYVFKTDGAFEKVIGAKGRGPEEFLTLADFDIDSTGNVYIIDRFKIVKYDNNGNFIKNFSLNIKRKDFPCYPEQLIVKEDGGFIVWVAYDRNLEYTEGVKYAIYEISESGKILNSYFPLNYHVYNQRHRFRKTHQEEYLIDPIFGQDTIFSISSDSIYAKYYIDFGKYKIREDLPTDNQSLSSFATRIDKCCGHTILHFTEIEDWIYFVFQYNGLVYTSYYSKVLDRTFVSQISPNTHPQKSFVWKIDANWGNSFVSFIEPTDIIDLLAMIDDNNVSLTKKEKELINTLGTINEFDNPVLFVVKMKEY
ncbi:MAG: 6-bladed beta-propeller, partial [Candidatus Hodarchaeales archaeon]